MILPCQIVASLLVIIMALYDIRKRIIPNALILALLSTGLISCAVLGIWPGFAEAVLVFATGFLLFRAGLFGGGDVKALSAAALILPGNLAPLCMVMAIVGGIQAVLAILWGFFRGRRVHDLPYGVAVAAGILFCVWS